MSHFAQGFSYVAGFDKPALLSIDTIRRYVEEEGFVVEGAWPCARIPGLPFAVPGHCGDNWDWIAIVRRTGPSRWLDVPDRVAWLVAVPPPQLPPPTRARPGEVPPPPQPTGPTLVQTTREPSTAALVADKVALGVELAGVAAAPLLWRALEGAPQSRRRIYRGMIVVGAAGSLASLLRRVLS